MNIALIITCLGLGGAETQVADLADRLARLGHTVLIISLTDEMIVLPKNTRVRVESLAMNKNPACIVTAYRRACHLLREFEPDVVHSHMVHANIFARLLRLRTPVPRLICTVHNTNEGGVPRMWAYRLTDRLATLMTYVSQEAAARSISRAAVLPDKTMVVHNGIDCDRFHFDPHMRKSIRRDLDIPENMQVLLAAGRLSDAKDYPNLLNAFNQVRKQRDDCVLWIAGGGDKKAQLQALAENLGLQGRVSFLGVRRDLPALMSAADIFVLSSAWEGFPLVIGEAMACERLIVSTDAGGVREWMGNTGHVVPVRDSAALANAIMDALALNSEVKMARGRAARERILASYSLDAVVARWEQIYRGEHDRQRAGVVLSS